MNDAWDGAEAFYRPGQEQQIEVDEPRHSKPGSGRSAADRVTTSNHSGLRLTMRDGVPVEPEVSARSAVQLQLKRLLLDLPLAAMALLVLSPMLIGIGLAIRLTSKGPALFRQTRVGLDGREFRMLKFRTLRMDECDETGLQQAVKSDSRVTPIGRYLRATSIDELPQLWNVLKGDMALVGPRPMVPGMLAAGIDYREAVPYYDYRHRVRPGLSGWAQANGLRGPTGEMASAKRRIDHDCAYVQNFSLELDVRIIVRTIVRESLTGSGV